MLRIKSLLRIEKMKANGGMTGRRESNGSSVTDRHHVGSFASNTIETRAKNSKDGNDKIQP